MVHQILLERKHLRAKQLWINLQFNKFFTDFCRQDYESIVQLFFTEVYVDIPIHFDNISIREIQNR